MNTASDSNYLNRPIRTLDMAVSEIAKTSVVHADPRVREFCRRAALNGLRELCARQRCA